MVLFFDVNHLLIRLLAFYSPVDIQTNPYTPKHRPTNNAKKREISKFADRISSDGRNSDKDMIQIFR